MIWQLSVSIVVDVFNCGKSNTALHLQEPRTASWLANPLSA